MAEYLTNTTDLKKVADAIRNKGGTTEPLIYPDGFVSSINNIIMPTYTLVVKTSPSSSITVTKDTKTFSGTADASGECTFALPEAGIWTVTATLEGGTKSASVTIGTQTLSISFNTLAQIAEGEFVKLYENDTLVDFYVACHNYEHTLNGLGRTLLVRKTSIGDRVWSENSENNYDGCSIDVYLNSVWFNLLSDYVKNMMPSTSIYYMPSYNSEAPGTLERKVFLGSETEYCGTHRYGPALGTRLPTYQAISAGLPAKASFWTRCPSNENRWFAVLVGRSANDSVASSFTQNISYEFGIIPFLTLPATTPVFADSLIG